MEAQASIRQRRQTRGGANASYQFGQSLLRRGKAGNWLGRAQATNIGPDVPSGRR